MSCQLILAWVGGQSSTLFGAWMIEVPTTSHQVPCCCLSLHSIPLPRHCFIKFPAASEWVSSVLIGTYPKPWGEYGYVQCLAVHLAAQQAHWRTQVHRFPLKSQELQVKWLKVIPCKIFQPTSNSRVCSIHFCQQDFVQSSRDKRNRTGDIKNSD